MISSCNKIRHACVRHKHTGQGQ